LTKARGSLAILAVGVVSLLAGLFVTETHLIVGLGSLFVSGVIITLSFILREMESGVEATVFKAYAYFFIVIGVFAVAVASFAGSKALFLARVESNFDLFLEIALILTISSIALIAYEMAEMLYSMSPKSG
jgi:hypothetical protein